MLRLAKRVLPVMIAVASLMAVMACPDTSGEGEGEGEGE